MPGVEAGGRDWGVFARAAVIGALGAAVLFFVLIAAGWTARRASEIAFSLPALPFSVGLIGWSTVILSGNAIEGFSREFGGSNGWSSEGGRRAMAIMTVIGATGMVSASITAAIYGV